MKKIGILGGLAWPSTSEYYAGICRLCEQRHHAAKLAGVAAMPEMAIESLDVVKAASLFGRDGDEASWAAFDTYHREGLQRLERSGADFAVIACNTAHHRFAQITRGIGIPVLNILEVAARACAWIGTSRMLVFGTALSMRSSVFRELFEQHGIRTSGPRGDRDRRTILAIIAALQGGRIEGASRRINEIAMRARTNRLPQPTVYLGCTELALAFPDQRDAGVFESSGIRYVNSAALHIRAAFEYATSASPVAGLQLPTLVPLRLATSASRAYARTAGERKATAMPLENNSGITPTEAPPLHHPAA